jgi:amino acid permease
LGDSIHVRTSRHVGNLLTLPRLMVIPLSFLRRLDSLKYTSVVALISIGYLVVLVVYHFMEGDTLDRKGPVHVVEPNGFASALSTFPVIVFAYTCHQNVRTDYLDWG